MFLRYLFIIIYICYKNVRLIYYHIFIRFATKYYQYFIKHFPNLLFHIALIYYHISHIFLDYYIFVIKYFNNLLWNIWHICQEIFRDWQSETISKFDFAHIALIDWNAKFSFVTLSRNILPCYGTSRVSACKLGSITTCM